MSNSTNKLPTGIKDAREFPVLGRAAKFILLKWLVGRPVMLYKLK
jgi:hypothetical protein